MPSAMIQKIAEVFVLRRQFPLGGLYTREEMSLEENDNGNSGNMDVPMKSNPAPNKHRQGCRKSTNSRSICSATK